MSFRNHILGPLGNKPAAAEEPAKEKAPAFKEQIKEFARQQKAKLKQKKRSTIILYILAILAVLYITGVITSIIQVLTHLNVGRDLFHPNAVTENVPKYHLKLLPWEAWLCLLDIRYSVGAFLIVVLIVLYGFYWWIRNHVAMGNYTNEERSGASYKKQLQDATMGSAREMNEAEIAKNFLVVTPEELKEKNPRTLIFGTLPKSGNYILEKPVDRFDVPNRNCFVVGDAGSWKTSNFIVTNMKQLALRGDNCVCTDSAGEVFELTYQDFIDNGYDVFVINTTDTEHSDTMNFIGAVGNDLDLAKTITQTLVESTHKPTDRVDVFFEDGMKTLLPAIIIIVNTELKRYSSIEGIINFLIRYDTPEKMQEIFNTYKEKQPEAFKQFSLFMMSPVKDNFISNLAQRLDLFVSSSISRICSLDGFNIIEQLGSEKKTIVYIITDKTYAFIAALFLNIISKQLVDYAKKKCEGRVLPRKLFFYFEEFLTMGYVPNMGTFLSENRKFGFVYYLICQAIPQFFLRYDEREAKEIMSNCMYKFFYGTGDTDTAELFEKYCGDTTVRTMMTAYSNQFTKDKDQAREGVQQRKLYDYNELLTLEQEYFLLFVTHQHPLKLKKPFYKTIPGTVPETPERLKHFSKYVPHAKQINKAGKEKQSFEVLPSSPQPNSGNTEPQGNPNAAAGDNNIPPKETPHQNDSTSAPAAEPAPVEITIGNGNSANFQPNAPQTPGKQKKVAEREQSAKRKRGRPSNYDKMSEVATVNLIKVTEEQPKYRPCENAEEVSESGTGDYMIFKKADEKTDKLIRANKVVFDIDISEISVGGSIPPNKYCTYNTKYNIEKLRDQMQLSKEGHLLVGFARFREDKEKGNRTDYMFDSSNPSDHNISVPRANIIIRPVFRKLNGYSAPSPNDGTAEEYTPRHPELNNVSNTANTNSSGINGFRLT